MAAITLLQSLSTTTGTGPYTVTSFIPASESLLLVFVAMPGHTNYGQATVTDSIATMTFSRHTDQPRFNTSDGSIYLFVGDSAADPRSRTLSIGIGNDPADG